MGTSRAVTGSGTTSVKNMMAATNKIPNVMYAFVGSSGSVMPKGCAATAS